MNNELAIKYSKNNKINILILLTASYLGGAENLILRQMKYFNTTKLNIHVVTLRKGKLEEEFRATIHNYFSLDNKKRFSLSTLFFLQKYIKKNKINVLHTHLIEADLYGFFLKIFNPTLKVISTRHNKDDFRKKIKWRFFNFLFSRADEKIICVSESVKRFVMKYEFINEKKILVIYNGIESNEFIPIINKEMINSKGKRTFKIGIAGRLDKQKGHVHLFNAVKILKEKHGLINLKVIVAGIGNLELELKSMRNKMDLEKEIEFLGYVDNFPELFSTFDIFCFPSDFEGLPTVLLEAMSCECLVICSDIDNNLEIVESGVDAITFKKRDPIDLVKKIIQVYNGEVDIERIKRAARNKVVNCFDIEKSVHELQNLYENITG